MFRFPYNNQNNITSLENKLNNRSSSNTQPPTKKKVCFKSLKKDTCSALNDVEHFLCNFESYMKYIKLYKLLKK